MGVVFSPPCARSEIVCNPRLPRRSNILPELDMVNMSSPNEAPHVSVELPELMSAAIPFVDIFEQTLSVSWGEPSWARVKCSK